VVLLEKVYFAVATILFIVGFLFIVGNIDTNIGFKNTSDQFANLDFNIKKPNLKFLNKNKFVNLKKS
jgi:hypothetical protein